MRLNLSLFILLLSLSASMPAAAEIITIRCHEPNSQRGELDLNIVLNTETKQVTEFASWKESETLFWSDEVIYWLSKGDYSEQIPAFALAAYHPPTAQLIIETLYPTDFSDDSLSQLAVPPNPPMNCYRSGL